MSNDTTTTGAPGARVESAKVFAECIRFDFDEMEEVGGLLREYFDIESAVRAVEQRDAAIDARARREERAAVLEEVDLVLRRLRLLYGDMGHAIAAVRNLARPNAAPGGSDGGVAL